jgi:hypothetical protein
VETLSADGNRRGESRTPARVEETRRRVEKMAVEETEQAGGILRNMAGRAKDGWERMRRMLEGKKLVWKGSSGRMIAVAKETEGVEDKVMDLEEEMDGRTVEIEKEVNEEETVSGYGRSLLSKEAEGGWVDMGVFGGD